MAEMEKQLLAAKQWLEVQEPQLRQQAVANLAAEQANVTTCRRKLEADMRERQRRQAAELAALQERHDSEGLSEEALAADSR